MDKQTILKKHHDMWMYIAEVLRTDKEWQKRYLEDQGITIIQLKQQYLGLNETKETCTEIEYFYYSCYCCYYDKKQSCSCRYCPVVWGDALGCMGPFGEYRKLICRTKTIEKAVDLCIKIANLPEREGV